MIKNYIPRAGDTLTKFGSPITVTVKAVDPTTVVYVKKRFCGEFRFCWRPIGEFVRLAKKDSAKVVRADAV